MKNTIHLSSETTISYHYKPERDELTVQLRTATGTVHNESLAEWEHIELQREQPSGEVVGFTIRSVQQVLLEQLVRSLTESLQPHFTAAHRPIAEAGSEPEAQEPLPETELFVPAGEAGETHSIEEVGGEVPVTVIAEAQPTVAETEPAPPEAEAVAETPAPTKKSRSRRRNKAKKEAQPEAIAELEAIVESNQESSEAQESVASEKAPVEDMAGEMIEAVAQAERVEAEPEATPMESEAVVEPPALKKSRSRRSKSKKAAAETVAESAPIEAIEAVEAVAETPTTAQMVTPLVATETEEPPKKSRSRRRKKSDPVAEPVVAEATTTPPDVAEEAAPKAATKSRSRRRKKSDPEATPVIAEAESVPTDVASVDDTGSIPTSASETVAETEANPETTSDETTDAVAESATATVASTEESAKRKRRKRRKRRSGTTAVSGETATAPEAGTPVVEKPAPRDPASAPSATPNPAPSAPVFRSAYKSAPIEGLEAPDEFLFMGLDPLIGQALHAMGYESPTAIQRRAVPDAMERRDIVGLAQTGTGKTLAFLLPSLNRMLKNPIQGHRPRLLVLTPTRELALQVATEAEYLATHTDFVIAAIYGQEDMKRQIRLLRDGVDVVVATPGRLLDHLQRGTIRLNSVETVVLDEADRMLDMGFLPDVRKILNRVPPERQTMMFSATMPQAVQSLSLDFQREPVLIEVARQLPPAQIDQKLYPVERHLKIPLLEHLLKQDAGMRSVMIFTETKAEADIVHRKLSELGQSPAIMHGDISQRERERALGQLRNGTVRMLVATNVAARGLDIQDVTHVINYEVPQTVDDYVHRIGRTARGEGSEGTAMTFVSSGDDGMIKRIESALERTLPRVYAEGFNYDVPTPSWAKPSADDIAASLTKPKNLAERFGRMMRRR